MLYVFHAFVSYYTVLYGIITYRIISYCIAMLPMVYQNYSIVASVSYKSHHIVAYIVYILLQRSLWYSVLLLITHRHLIDDSDDITPCHIVSYRIGAAGEFSSPGSTFCADSYFGIHSTPVLPQQHVKDPGHSAKSAGGRLQLNTHTPYVCGFA